MYDKDAFMLADAPGNRVNLGTVNLDAGDLVFRDGSSPCTCLTTSRPIRMLVPTGYPLRTTNFD